MSNRDRIEFDIRKISHQLNKDIVKQQKQGTIPGKVDLSMLEAMVDKWDELATYYERNIYDRTSDGDADLDISLFIIKNYLSWQDDLPREIYNARQSNNENRAGDLEDFRDLLEHSINRIFKAIRVIDEFFP